MGFYEELIEAMRTSLQEDFNGKMSHMGKACSVHPSTLKRLLDGERSTWAQALGRIADAAQLQVLRKSTSNAGKKETKANYTACSFDVELKNYLNGLISLQKKNAHEVATKACPDTVATQKRILAFLEGRGPLWASDIPLLATALHQHPDELVKTIIEMVEAESNKDVARQTLVS
jgi:hypothetical protein